MFQAPAVKKHLVAVFKNQPIRIFSLSLLMELNKHSIMKHTKKNKLRPVCLLWRLKGKFNMSFTGIMTIPFFVGEHVAYEAVFSEPSG